MSVKQKTPNSEVNFIQQNEDICDQDRFFCGFYSWDICIIQLLSVMVGYVVIVSFAYLVFLVFYLLVLFSGAGIVKKFAYFA